MAISEEVGEEINVVKKNIYNGYENELRRKKGELKFKSCIVSLTARHCSVV